VFWGIFLFNKRTKIKASLFLFSIFLSVLLVFSLFPKDAKATEYPATLTYHYLDPNGQTNVYAGYRYQFCGSIYNQANLQMAFDAGKLQTRLYQQSIVYNDTLSNDFLNNFNEVPSEYTVINGSKVGNSYYSTNQDFNYDYGFNPSTNYNQSLYNQVFIAPDGSMSHNYQPDGYNSTYTIDNKLHMQNLFPNEYYYELWNTYNLANSSLYTNSSFNQYNYVTNASIPSGTYTSGNILSLKYADSDYYKAKSALVVGQQTLQINLDFSNSYTWNELDGDYLLFYSANETMNFYDGNYHSLWSGTQANGVYLTDVDNYIYLLKQQASSFSIQIDYLFLLDPKLSSQLNYVLKTGVPSNSSFITSLGTRTQNGSLWEIDGSYSKFLSTIGAGSTLDTGWLTAGTAANVDLDDKTAWTNPDYAKTDDANNADLVLTSVTYGDYLKLTNFGATVPVGATITGIQVQIYHTRTYVDIHDNIVKLVRDGTIEGTNKASPTQWVGSGSYEMFTYGNSTDLWGLTWTVAQANSANTGLVLSPKCTNTNGWAYVDYMNIKFYYMVGTGMSALNFTSNIQMNFGNKYSNDTLDYIKLYYSLKTNVSTVVNVSLWNFGLNQWFKINSSTSLNYYNNYFMLNNSFYNATYHIRIKIASNSTTYTRFELYLNKLKVEYKWTKSSGDIHTTLSKSIVFDFLNHYDTGFDDYLKLFKFDYIFTYRYTNYTSYSKLAKFNGVSLTLDGSWHTADFYSIYDSATGDGTVNLEFNISNGLLEIRILKHVMWFGCIDAVNGRRQLQQIFAVEWSDGGSLSDFVANNGQFYINVKYNFTSVNDGYAYTNTYDRHNRLEIHFAIYADGNPTPYITLASTNSTSIPTYTLSFNATAVMKSLGLTKFEDFAVTFIMIGNNSRMNVFNVSLWDKRAVIPMELSIIFEDTIPRPYELERMSLIYGFNTSNMQKMNFSIYTFSSGVWQLLNNSKINNKQIYYNNWTITNFSYYYSSALLVRFRFESGYNFSMTITNFSLNVYIKYYYRTGVQVSIWKTLYIPGTVWEYRFGLRRTGTNDWYYTDWIMFGVMAPVPNFQGISESPYMTQWQLVSENEVPNMILNDSFTVNNWDLYNSGSRYMDIVKYCSEDSYVNQSNPTANYGSNDYLYSGNDLKTNNVHPNGAISSGWSATGSPQYTTIDESESSPNTADYIYKTGSGETTCTFNMGTFTMEGSASIYKIDVNVYYRNVVSYQYGVIYIATSFSPSYSSYINPPYDSNWHWGGKYWSGLSKTQSDLNSLTITLKTYGTDGTLYVACAYATVYYYGSNVYDTYLKTTNQSSYLTNNLTSSLKIGAYSIFSNTTTQEVHLYATSNFNEATLTYNNKPSAITDLGQTQVSLTSLPKYITLSLGSNCYYYYILKSDSMGRSEFISSENPTYTTYLPYILYHISKNYQNKTLGYWYIQTNKTETLNMRGQKYGSNITINSGDYLKINLQTTTTKEVVLKLLCGGVVKKELRIIPSENNNFEYQSVDVLTDTKVTFDQLMISGEFDNTKYFKCYYIEGYLYNLTGDIYNIYVEPSGRNQIRADIGNYTLKIYENNILKTTTIITITNDLYTYIYKSIKYIECKIYLYSQSGESLNFDSFHIYITKTYFNSTISNWLTTDLFKADENTQVNFLIYDIFYNLIKNTTKPSFYYIDIQIDVYELKISHGAQESSSIVIQPVGSGYTITELLTPNELVSYDLGINNYTITWINGENGNTTIYSISLTQDRLLILPSTYYQLYVSCFNFDGLGLDTDWVRLYINNLRKDFGFNTMKYEWTHFVVMDFFNATLADELVYTRAFTEYNIYIQVYNLILNNNYTHSIYITIERPNIDITIKQIIPAQSGISYRFLPNVDYIISYYHMNGTKIGDTRITLETNNQIVSFGWYTEEQVPTVPTKELISLAGQMWLDILAIISCFIVVISFILYLLRKYYKKNKEQQKYINNSNKTKTNLEVEGLLGKKKYFK
jgi:hypothetical protein